MSRKLQYLSFLCCATALSACTKSQNFPNFQSYFVSHKGYPAPHYQYSYIQSQEKAENYEDYSQATATVPDSYFTGGNRSPGSHRDADRHWVSSQNPKGYTIELEESDKASQVATKLYKAPKGDRTAEIKYNQGGQAYYKGLYGSYNSYEDAEKALNNLPLEIKQGANIKSWEAIQILN